MVPNIQEAFEKDIENNKLQKILADKEDELQKLRDGYNEAEVKSKNNLQQ